MARPCRVGPDAQPSAVLEALRRHVGRYQDCHRADPARMHVLRRLFACRTAELGMHLCVCEACDWQGTAFNSCRDRHCPQCQGHATAQWLEAREARMLPTPHFQVVFTLPAELREIAFDNQKLVYGLLFRAATSVLQDLATQRLKARLGITAVLHTWTSELNYHIHLHCLVTAGGLHLKDDRWVSTRDEYLFPGPILGAMFRGRLLEGLIDALDGGDLRLRGDEAQATKALRATVRAVSKRHARWVVHVEPPKGRPVEYITKYLARYVKRVAISDNRILGVSDTTVTFRARRGVVELDGAEFVRRFLLHILPSGFRKVRHYGLYAPGNAKVRLETARRLLPLSPSKPSALGDLTDGDSDISTDASPSPPCLEVCPACGEARVRRIFAGARSPPPPTARGSP